jgi:hypothetical protein
MKTDRFLQKELIYSTLETYFTLEEEEHLAPNVLQQMKKWLNRVLCKFDNAVKVSGRTEKGLGIGFLELTKGHLQQ